jgi:ketosteroid isomerase-like protein
MLRGLQSGGFARFSVAALLLFLLAGPIFASKRDAPHRKRKDVYKDQVEQMEHAWRSAQLANDVSAMDKLLSDDYVGITMQGQVVTKLQQLDRMRNRQLLLTRLDLDDVKIKLIGSTAVVTSLVNVDGTMDGQDMHGMYRYTRVYSRQPSGTWKITNFEVTRVNHPGGPRHHARNDQHSDDSGPPPE